MAIKVCFEVEFFPTPGLEVPCLVGSIPELGSWNNMKGLIAVRTERENVWSVGVELSTRSFFFYKWISTRNGKLIQNEPTNLRSFSLGVSGGTIKSTFGNPGIDFRLHNSCRLHLKTNYNLNYNESLGIVGAGDNLGNWKNAVMAVEVNSHGNHEVMVDMPIGVEAEFKWVVVDKESRNIIRWQEGENRKISLEEGTDECRVFVPWKGEQLVIPEIKIHVCSDDLEINSEKMASVTQSITESFKLMPTTIPICDGKVATIDKAVGVIAPIYKKSTEELEVPAMNERLVKDIDRPTSENQSSDSADQERKSTHKGREFCQKIWNAVSCFWNLTDYYPNMLYI